jgi:uncharacterized membrane protein
VPRRAAGADHHDVAEPGGERDRVESTHDYETDLKAEIEIASLHDKVDHLLHAQWERMVELQEMQMELLTELTRRTHR